MLSSRFWGRPTVAWAIDALVLAVVIFLLTTSSIPTVRTVALLMLGWRVLTIAAGVLAWRLRTRAARRT